VKTIKNARRGRTGGREDNKKRPPGEDRRA